MIVNENKQTEKLTNFCRAICFPLSIFYSYFHLLVDALFLEALIEDDNRTISCFEF